MENLRAQVMNLSADSAGIHPTDDLPRVWGALLETGYTAGAATLVCLADGTTSLYTTSGFGIIGGGGHPDVVRASLQFLAAVEGGLDAFIVDPGTGLPARGETQFGR